MALGVCRKPFRRRPSPTDVSRPAEAVPCPEPLINLPESTIHQRNTLTHQITGPLFGAVCALRIFQPNLAQFCPLARVVAGFLSFVTFHNVAMHVKFNFLP
jgi:hypothetical protein